MDAEADIGRLVGTIGVTTILYLINRNCQIRRIHHGLKEGQKQCEQSEAAMHELSEASVPETLQTSNNLQ
jgi:hypothetical protein